jgi:hypothetical protein
VERRYGVGYDWRNAAIDGRLCMLLVAESLMDGEIITIYVPCFDVLIKYTLHNVQRVDRLD